VKTLTLSLLLLSSLAGCDPPTSNRTDVKATNAPALSRTVNRSDFDAAVSRLDAKDYDKNCEEILTVAVNFSGSLEGKSIADFIKDVWGLRLSWDVVRHAAGYSPEKDDKFIAQLDSAIAGWMALANYADLPRQKMNDAKGIVYIGPILDNIRIRRPNLRTDEDAKNLSTKLMMDDFEEALGEKGFKDVKQEFAAKGVDLWDVESKEFEEGIMKICMLHAEAAKFLFKDRK
jgi:hypothetical protein